MIHLRDTEAAEKILHSSRATRPSERHPPSPRYGAFLGVLCASVVFFGAPGGAQEKKGDEKPVSYAKDIVPILKASCAGCHNPQKKKGKLDMTTHAGLMKGGAEGPAIVSGKPEKSHLVEMVSGKEPEMPEKGDPLKPEQVALISRWIKEGAKDDTPKAGEGSAAPKGAPETYPALPVVSRLAFSPDGKVLVVPGYHEILLHKADGSGLLARLQGESSRIDALDFTADGKWLAACGGAPAQFGEVQVWDVAAQKLVHSYKLTHDQLFGISFSPDGTKVAFACSDKSVRILAVADGKELLSFTNHTDWVYGTTFTMDGKKLLTGSKDRAMKLVDAANGQFIDDVNKLLEPVLCLARHPKQDTVVYGGGLGTPRVYRIKDNQGRTAANNDTNLVREFERQPGPVRSVAFSPDGNLIAVGSSNPEVRLYNVQNGQRTASLKGHGGAVFALAFHPDGKTIATGGFDGQVRIFEVATGKLVASFAPVPVAGAEKKPEEPKKGS